MQERHKTSSATNPRKRSTFRGGEYVANLMAELSRVGIAQRVQKAREEAGLTQAELAELLHVHWRTVQNWESQARPIVAWDRLGEIADATGVSRNWLIHGEPEAVEASDETLKQILERVNEFTAEGSRSAMEALRFLQDRLAAGVQMTEENQTVLAALADAVARLERGQMSMLEQLDRLEQLAGRLQPPEAPQAQPQNGV